MNIGIQISNKLMHHTYFNFSGEGNIAGSLKTSVSESTSNMKEEEITDISSNEFQSNENKNDSKGSVTSSNWEDADQNEKEEPLDEPELVGNESGKKEDKAPNNKKDPDAGSKEPDEGK